MASKAATKRLGKESVLMEKDPPPLCYARPKDDNILEWHFILRGPPDTPYEGGEYWGQLLFPSDYPFKPPGIKLQTPSGRFQPDTKICTSMSDYHPGSWNPAWSVANILIGLLSFMCTDEMTAGSVMATQRERRTLAAKSHAFNVTQRKFTHIFPDYAGPSVKDLPNMSRPPNVATTEPTRAAPTTEPSSVKPEETNEANVHDREVPLWNPRNVGLSVVVVVSCLFAAKLIDAMRAK